MTLGLGTSALLIATMAGPVMAADTVTQSITAGSLSASIANLTLASVTYQNAAHDVTGTMILTADDQRDLGLGWKVTIQTSAFAYTGGGGGTAFPAANLALTSAAAPATVAGQVAGVAAATGPQVPPTFVAGTLDTPRTTLWATAAYGKGTYTQALDITLTIPAMSNVGTYTGTLTTTIVTL